MWNCITVSAAMAVSTVAATVTAATAAAAASTSEFVTEQSTGTAAQFSEEEGLRASDQSEEAQKGLKNSPHNMLDAQIKRHAYKFHFFFLLSFSFLLVGGCSVKKMKRSRNSARGFTKFC